MNFQQIIIRPLFTEKSSKLEEERKYAFQVAYGVNKIEIKRAIEEKFEVEVEKVSTMNRAGKEKNMTVRSNGRTIRTKGTKSRWKKALVKLKEGHSIDLLRNEEAK